MSVAILVVAPAAADVHYYDVVKTVSYTQTSNAQAIDADSWLFTGGLYYDASNEVAAATISYDMPPPVLRDMYQATPLVHLYYSSFFATQGELDAEHPSTTYTFTVDRGGQPEVADVFLPVDLYCPEIPWFTGDTHDRLQVYDASQPFDVYINGFTLLPGANLGLTQVAISERGVGSVYVTQLNPEDTWVQVPADALQPGRNYDISISYTSFLETPNAGFVDATSSASFSRGTSASFDTLPDGCAPCDANCDGVIDAFDIEPFIAILVSPAPTPCSPCAGDASGDGVIDAFDIEPFIACLVGP